MREYRHAASVSLQGEDGAKTSQTPLLYLAVYGTLMRGRANHAHFCSGYLDVQEVTIRGTLRWLTPRIPMALALTIFLSVLSLITAVIQAYIFTVLALVYIGAAVQRRDAKTGK